MCAYVCMCISGYRFAAATSGSVAAGVESTPSSSRRKLAVEQHASVPLILQGGGVQEAMATTCAACLLGSAAHRPRKVLGTFRDRTACRFTCGAMLQTPSVSFFLPGGWKGVRSQVGAHLKRVPPSDGQSCAASSTCTRGCCACIWRAAYGTNFSRNMQNRSA